MMSQEHCRWRLDALPVSTESLRENITSTEICRSSEKPWFLKKPNLLGFWVLLGSGLNWVFRIFIFERAVGKLVGWFSSLAKLLFRFASSLDYLKICKFITYRSLEAENMGVWCGFSAAFLQRVLPNKTGRWFFGYYPSVWTLKFVLSNRTT